MTHALRHRFDGNSSAFHLYMNEERGWGEARAVCFYQVNVTVTWRKKTRKHNIYSIVFEILLGTKIPINSLL